MESPYLRPILRVNQHSYAMSYEYKVVPAPSRGRKTKGRKTNADRFAFSVEETLNEHAADGWEYLRAELLPSDERSGLSGVTREWRNVLIFRRALMVMERQHQPMTNLRPTRPASQRMVEAEPDLEDETDDFYAEAEEDEAPEAPERMEAVQRSRTPPEPAAERLSPLARAVQIAKGGDDR